MEELFGRRRKINKKEEKKDTTRLLATAPESLKAAKKDFLFE